MTSLTSRRHPLSRTAGRAVMAASLALAVVAIAHTDASADDEWCTPRPVTVAALPEVCVPVGGVPLPADEPEGSRPAATSPVGPVVVATHRGDTVGSLQIGIRSDGRAILAGRLPDLAGHTALVPVTDESLWPCPMRADDEAVGFAPLAFRSLEVPGTLIAGPTPPQPELAVGQTTVIVAYADGATRVFGECWEPETPLLVDVELVAGWNLLASVVEERDGRGVFVLRAASDEEVVGTRWSWRAGPERSAEPPEVERRDEPPPVPVEPPPGR